MSALALRSLMGVVPFSLVLATVLLGPSRSSHSFHRTDCFWTTSGTEPSDCRGGRGSAYRGDIAGLRQAIGNSGVSGRIRQNA